jgi:hypothetical protein
MHGHRTTYGRRLLLVAGLTGIVGGLTTAWTSSNGLANAVIGLMPALIVSLALLADRTPTFPLRVLAIGAIVLLAASLHYGAWHYPYREDAISKLTARITSGPYAGLATIPDKRKLLVDLQADLRHEFAGATRTVLFYDNFPAGYLMAALRPLAPSVWIPPSDQYPQFDRSFYSHYYSVPEHLPDIVVEFRSIPITEANEVSLTALPYSMRGFFWRLGYPVVADREHYTVYRRCKTCAFSVYDLEMATTVKPIPNYAAAAERGWTWYVNPLADGGRAAVTTHPQASISLALSDVPPGPQFVDLSFYCYGPEARNELALSGGATSRRIVIGPGCPGGWHRAANLRLEELTSPLEIRAVSIGQPAIIVDTLLIRRQSAIALRPVMRGFVSVSEESFAWRRLEQSSDYASKAGQGWVSYRSPELSKGSAAITTRAGSPLDASIPDFVRNADYAVSLAVHNYNSPSRNEIEIRQGTQTQLLSFGPESPAGLTRRDVTFNNVQSPQLTVRAAAIGQEALILDYIEVRRIGSPP